MSGIEQDWTETAKMKFTSAEIPGEPPIPVKVARSPRTRNIKLRVSRTDGIVTLSMPARADLAEGLEFAASKRSWIFKTLENVEAVISVRYGIDFPLKGVFRKVSPATSPAVCHDASDIFVPGPEADVPKNLLRYCVEMASQELLSRSNAYAEQIDRKIFRITIRDTKSRWGSCTKVTGTRGGRINYSWRLIMAPLPVLDYVAAHEVAHLVEPNHSGRFWSVVEKICPDYDDHRAWLKKNGNQLQRYVF